MKSRKVSVFDGTLHGQNLLSLSNHFSIGFCWIWTWNPDKVLCNLLDTRAHKWHPHQYLGDKDRITFPYFSFRSKIGNKRYCETFTENSGRAEETNVKHWHIFKDESSKLWGPIQELRWNFSFSIEANPSVIKNNIAKKSLERHTLCYWKLNNLVIKIISCPLILVFGTNTGQSKTIHSNMYLFWAKYSESPSSFNNELVCKLSWVR